MIRLLIISGATATGKTDLAVRLAKKHNGELVSADSRQVYTGLDVISGKDIPHGSIPMYRLDAHFRGARYPLVTFDMHGVPIWLYDAVPPDVLCSISQYRELAMAAITDITARGKLPIIVGGAGLYIDAIIHPPATIAIPTDSKLRTRLEVMGVSELQEELLRINAPRLTRMNNSDRQNPRRLVRAVETELWKMNNSSPDKESTAFDYCWVGLSLPMEILASRITKRVSDRWENGALEEVKKLGSVDTRKPMASTLGLAPIKQFLAGELTEDEAMALWAKDEIAYAKRQITWFAGRDEIHRFDVAGEGFPRDIEMLVSEWYTTI